MENQNAVNPTDITEEDIALAHELHAQIKEQMAAPVELPKEVDKSEVPEAWMVDPDLVLVELNAVSEKHGVDFGQYLADLGFTKEALQQFLSTKAVPEVINAINRRTAIELYRYGNVNCTPTQEIRGTLGSIPPSKGWLTVMDEIIFPYIAYFKKHGVVDEDFFVKDNNGMYIFDAEGNRIEPQAEKPVLKTEDQASEETPKEA